MNLAILVRNANTGEPIPRATVTIKATTGTTQQIVPMNDVGSGVITVNGTERIYITAVGFAPIDVPVGYYTPGQTVKIDLFPVATTLPAVVVTPKKNNWLWYAIGAIVIAKATKII